MLCLREHSETKLALDSEGSKKRACKAFAGRLQNNLQIAKRIFTSIPEQFFSILGRMNGNEKRLFDILLQKVEARFSESFPDCQKGIKDWTRFEIERFQEDMNDKVNGQISERWFYDHIKVEKSLADKLPRIDMLDLLSQYCRYQNWEEFSARNSRADIENHKLSKEHTKVVQIGFRKYSLAGLSFVILGMAMYLIWIFGIRGGADVKEPVNMIETRGYQFCVVDAISLKPVENGKIEMLLDEESSVLLHQSQSKEKQGCFTWYDLNPGKVQLVISAPYYKTDTITRNITQVNQRFKTEEIPLRSDDYAMMLHYFSRSKVEDWNKRRKQLEQILSEDVVVYQVHEENNQALGMEMMNKTEFIFKLTTPVASLKNIRILETKYSNNKINMVRFVQEEASAH